MNDTPFPPGWDLTQLGRYIQDTGTQAKWLAEQCFVSPSTVGRWIRGQTGMSQEDRERILQALRKRAQIDLTGLLDDQYEPQPRGPRH